MNMELPVGMMTPYFVTQAERSITSLTDPTVLVSREPLSMETLELFLAFISEDPPPPKKPAGFRFFGKKQAEPPTALLPALDRARAMLKAITAETRWPSPSESVYVSHPVVVLANTIIPEALQALVVIKLRGYIMSVALDISSCMDKVPAFTKLLGKEKPDGTRLFGDSRGIVTGYSSYRGLTIVSGLRATAFATGLTADQIIDKYRDLVSPDIA